MTRCRRCDADLSGGFALTADGIELFCDEDCVINHLGYSEKYIEEENQNDTN